MESRLLLIFPGESLRQFIVGLDRYEHSPRGHWIEPVVFTYIVRMNSKQCPIFHVRLDSVTLG